MRFTQPPKKMSLSLSLFNSGPDFPTQLHLNPFQNGLFLFANRKCDCNFLSFGLFVLLAYGVLGQI